ncbi:DUF2931 family protein [Aeromonas sobria]|uniref:DUF2931 family protein n=1 Tax=Aeromonas sobria TaxID=646 RepID=UPI003F323C44
MDHRWIAMSLLALGLMAGSTYSSASGSDMMNWRYMSGSNADEIWHSKANFYREGKPIHGSGNGALRAVSAKSLKNKDYHWFVSGGRSLDKQVIPDQVVLEWVSYHDKKRYGITLALPKDLGAQMAQGYRVDNQITQRNIIGLGMAPGGYVEVFLTRYNVKPDILLVRGLAHEVTDDYYDKRVPLSKQYGFDEFYQKYGAAYQQHPIPMGMAWAPIMDAYRAAQPKTDTNPVN